MKWARAPEEAGTRPEEHGGLRRGKPYGDRVPTLSTTSERLHRLCAKATFETSIWRILGLSVLQFLSRAEENQATHFSARTLSPPACTAHGRQACVLAMGVLAGKALHAGPQHAGRQGAGGGARGAGCNLRSARAQKRARTGGHAGDSC